MAKYNLNGFIKEHQETQFFVTQKKKNDLKSLISINHHCHLQTLHHAAYK